MRVNPLGIHAEVRPLTDEICGKKKKKKKKKKDKRESILDLFHRGSCLKVILHYTVSVCVSACGVYRFPELQERKLEPLDICSDIWMKNIST